jgi:hypothetical protein
MMNKKTNGSFSSRMRRSTIAFRLESHRRACRWHCSPEGTERRSWQTNHRWAANRRRLAKIRHPSGGGSEASMTALNVARDEAPRLIAV